MTPAPVGVHDAALHDADHPKYREDVDVLVETAGIAVLIDRAVAVDGDLRSAEVDPVIAPEVAGREPVVVQVAVRHPRVRDSDDPDRRRRGDRRPLGVRALVRRSEGVGVQLGQGRTAAADMSPYEVGEKIPAAARAPVDVVHVLIGAVGRANAAGAIAQSRAARSRGRARPRIMPRRSRRPSHSARSADDRHVEGHRRRLTRLD